MRFSSGFREHWNLSKDGTREGARVRLSFCGTLTAHCVALLVLFWPEQEAGRCWPKELGFSSALNIEPQTVLWKEVEGVTVFFCMCVHIKASVYRVCVVGTYSTWVLLRTLLGWLLGSWSSRPLTCSPVELRSGSLSGPSAPSWEETCCRGCFSPFFFLKKEKNLSCVLFYFFLQGKKKCAMCFKTGGCHINTVFFPCTPFHDEVLYHLYLSTFMPDHILFHRWGWIWNGRQF